MKKTLLSLLAVGAYFGVAYAQEDQSDNSSAYYGSEQEYANNVKFTGDQKKFDSWSVGVYGGLPILVKSDLQSASIFGGENAIDFGYDVGLALTKHINHVIGIQLYGQMGHSSQSLKDTKYTSETDYQAVSLLGDINLSSLLRRVDNKSRYAWALHLYGGTGVLGYDVEAKEDDTSIGEDSYDMDFNSMFLQGGLGLQYKLSQSLDLELRSLLIITDDEQFDGSAIIGTSSKGSDNEPNDRILTTSLGLIWKIGKHNEHLKWYDPLAALYPPKDGSGDGFECLDEDADGVCDQWDKCPDTPTQARVDGSGCPLDTDLDGFLDFEDACVTVPGVVDGVGGKGCPKETENTIVTPIEVEQPQIIDLSGVEFYYNEARWYPEYNKLLDKAVRVMKANPDANFVLEGHTDARGSDTYNLTLSQKRADAIKAYFIKSGVDGTRVTASGKGESEILNHCVNGVKCSNEEHRVNRRVFLRADRQLAAPTY